MYGRAIEFLEGALTIIPRPTLFGGEVGYIPYFDNHFVPGKWLFPCQIRCHVLTMKLRCGVQIQIWLAMAYEANNRHADCIALYQQLEKKHPSVSIRRQAADLRYILQAPKLKISQEEMVTIPLIGSSYDRWDALDIMLFFFFLKCSFFSLANSSPSFLLSNQVQASRNERSVHKYMLFLLIGPLHIIYKFELEFEMEDSGKSYNFHWLAWILASIVLVIHVESLWWACFRSVYKKVFFINR